MKIESTQTALCHTTDKGVVCDLCPHHCTLHEQQYGICRNRFCQDGVIHSDVYGRPCALNIDPVEKKPLLHFHPAISCLSLGTTGCNFACANCQNSNISQIYSDRMPTSKVMPLEVVDACCRNDCPAIAYTYNEPVTFFEYTYDTAVLAHERDIWNILVSDGYINSAPLDVLCSVIDAANIDLKSFSDELYHRINHASLRPVLDTLLKMKEAGVWLEITNLLIPTINDDRQMIKEMCHWLVTNGFEDTPLHFSRFYPAFKMMDVPATPLETLVAAREIAQEEGLKYVYLGNVREMEGENTYCPSCHELLVRRRSFNVLQNHIKNGKCPHCGTAINGKW